MDMSSYQFVNTLAQCYEANAQLQGSSAAGVATGAAADYYGMQYPNCYSPATQGYQGAAGAAGYTNMMNTAPSTGAASTQPPPLEYAPTSSSTTSLSTHTPSSSRRSPGPGAAGAGGGGTPAPLTTANVACKYQDSNVGSPQDLSTTSSGGGTPHPGGMPGGLKSPDSDIEDDDDPTSPMSPGDKEGGASSSATSTKKEDSKSTPPQIYPWMKRVHLGQSKCHFPTSLLMVGAGHNYKPC